jgi:hypothetical protein
MSNCNLIVLILIKASLEIRLNLWFLCIAFSATFQYNVKHIEIETRVANCWNTLRPSRTIEAEPVGKQLRALLFPLLVKLVIIPSVIHWL